ncbi:MAG: 2,3-bisphosphoglycerate-independent phosphoglycerate mutase [Thermodesulfobacteriota bacterium]
MVPPKPLVLLILDGWGIGGANEANAVHVARTPAMDRLLREYPHTTLVAHNGAVGLPEGQMGNSEVGHLNIGAGRVVYQDFTRINRAIETGAFAANPVLQTAMRTAAADRRAVHLLGLLSDGGVHSHIDHLVALLEMAADNGVENVYVHAFMDGRDTPPESGGGYMRRLRNAIARIGVGMVATICGRYYIMDRDNRWERVEQGWKALVDGEGIPAVDPVAAVEAAYGRGETDEFIKPMVMVEGDGRPLARVEDGDVIVSFNFRADRARQFTRALTEPEFNGFVRRRRPRLGGYVTFTEYDRGWAFPVAFPPAALDRILGEEVSRAGMTQLRIAETEKYAHVTYFFNGGREEPYPGEERVLIPSPKDVATYDLKPEMSADAVTDELLRRLDADRHDLVVLNFANGDMVGHSGDMAAAVAACEAVDRCVARVVEAVAARGGVSLITADHGNADVMVDPQTGERCTAHTLNPVPFVLVADRFKSCRLRSGGALKDIAPTILFLLGLPVPAEMEGDNLLDCGGTEPLHNEDSSCAT